MTVNTTWLDQLFLFPGKSLAIGLSDANRVEDANNLVNTFNLQYTGALTANRTIQFPLPSSDEQAYNRTIYNNTSGGHALVISVGVGTTVTINAGVTKFLIFEPAGVRVSS